MAFDLFSPVVVGFADALLLSFVLGLLHGMTPDEHTWPITFSYAIGSFSVKGGARNGFIFSGGFTLSRALLCELFYFIFAYSLSGIGSFLESALFFALVYLAVGFVMALAGFYIRTGRWYPHMGLDLVFERRKTPRAHKAEDFYSRDVSGRMAFVHGLVAGFGVGAFALILFVIITPTMPSPLLGFVPGVLFGVGTMIMQIIFGAVFGALVTRVRRLGPQGLKFLARYMSSSVLLYGGLIFFIAGAVSLVFPQVLSYGVVTPIQVHNLHVLGLGFFIVMVSVGVVGILSYLKGVRLAAKRSETYG